MKVCLDEQSTDDNREMALELRMTIAERLILTGPTNPDAAVWAIAIANASALLEDRRAAEECLSPSPTPRDRVGGPAR